jgi:hypothetical protein
MVVNYTIIGLRRNRVSEITTTATNNNNNDNNKRNWHNLKDVSVIISRLYLVYIPQARRRAR